MKDLRCVTGCHSYAEHQIDGGHGTYLASAAAAGTSRTARRTRMRSGSS